MIILMDMHLLTTISFSYFIYYISIYKYKIEYYLLPDIDFVGKNIVLYGAGDGSTTFNLPNLVDRFVEGGSASGAVKNAGLPNITGELSVEGTPVHNQFLADDLPTVTGAFSVYGKGQRYGISDSETKKWGYLGLTFNAATANNIYGSSNTVQPPALVMKYIIKI